MRSHQEENRGRGHEESDGLSRALGYSVGFHVALLAAFAVRVVLFPSEPLEIQSAIRVDMVGLPDKGKQKALPAPSAPAKPKVAEAPKPEPKPEPAKPEPPKPKPVEIAKPEAPKVNLDKAKHQQEAALKRLEALQKLEKMMKSDKKGSSHAAATATAENTKPSATETAVIKGNALANGSALTGVARIDNQNYLRTINDHVKSHWNLPSWMANANFKAVVRVFVDSNGYVTKKELIRPSNNQTFDDRVMAAIENSNPFPRPPDTLVNRLAVYGMDLGFPE